ncbi:cell division control protein Cdc6 [Candidatus Marsarchaeota G2 archaeon OSP_D]|jgi:cell division control protein 6|uniref:ORC1-type DNA replication protein n=4 Tax=Candidatus Marsarchaeota group 2 TaxID=2203771 RepID=A0A2R6CCW7_9ARCH|nr:MAG: cell division control protein Cdc6 [Candidatus Marsarchaeota G2 archaeon OSP_D]PSN92944.1 MAG: cell division control protein Cdc6 [Candidatus Marsarchaeota G2 archaeon ECH_B_SAG-M15]PSN96172.1 MAG: cell division control protein Cdc6 [Candidatus Marsarchaeota G2 archaeon ECH_B_SAG-C16]PSO08737.1 MAG: cell division control protein Cdc6 [Candidatus Marsarchaeota G2 archaeon BE_D]
MTSQNLFSNLGKSRIFKNRSVLVSDFVPLTLPHRENEITRLAQIMSPALNGTRPNNIFMYGLTGTGKTAVAKYVSNMLTDEANRRGSPATVIYVNARKDDTSYRIITQIGRLLDLKLPFTGLSVAEVYSRVVSRIDKRGGIIIITIDEIDNLIRESNLNLLYKLSRINSDLRNAQVSLIGITNDARVLEVLDPRVKSSLGEEEIVFAPYNAEQLRDILHARVHDAFVEDSLEDDVVPYVASLAAKDHGDARKAVDLLRKAGEVAERLNSNRVTIDHVKQALSEIEVDTTLEIVTKLPLHSKLVLASALELQNKKEIVVTGDIYTGYIMLCKKTGLEPLTSRRVSEILNELDMVGIISTKILNRGRFGRTKRVVLNIKPTNILEALKKDDALKIM